MKSETETLNMVGQVVTINQHGEIVSVCDLNPVVQAYWKYVTTGVRPTNTTPQLCRSLQMNFCITMLDARGIRHTVNEQWLLMFYKRQEIIARMKAEQQPAHQRARDDKAAERRWYE